MSLVIGTNIDLLGNQLLNAGLQQLASDPGSPFEGQIWQNTTSDEVKAFLNGTVTILQSGPITSADIADGSIINGDINAAAAIARSKLDFGTGLVNADIDAAAAIAESKLNLASDAAAGTASRRTIGTGALQAMAGNTRLDTIAAPTGAVAHNGQKITGLADGTSATDAVTKQQLDSVAAGLDPHASVRLATTANITLSGAQSLDGVAVVTGDRILVKNQTTTTENGIWIANTSGAWTRASDADAAGELSGGTFTFIEEGTTQGDTGWVITTNGSITPGTTGHAWSQFSGAGTTLGGSGLTQTGAVLDVNVDGSSIEINADVLRVKALGITNAMIAAGTIDLTTKVTGLLPVANGGTNASTAAAARTSLAATGKFAADITGNAALTQFTVTHNLNTTDVVVQVFDVSNDLMILTDVKRPTVNTVRIDFAQAPANAKVYRVVVVG